MKAFLNLIILLAGCYLFIMLFVYFYQPRLIIFPNFPSRKIETNPSSIGLAYEEIELNTKDNVKIHSWFVPAVNERGVLLFCHGNAGNISHRLDSLLIFNRLGLSVLIFDYRGYGQSQGTPTEEGTYLDGQAALSYLLQERQVEPERLILFGRSLGGAVASKLATTHAHQALIIESCFTSVTEMAGELYPFLPVKLLSRYQYNVPKNLARASSPLLIIHSRNDEIIPFTHGLKLFETAGNPKYFLELRGGHNDGFILSGDDYFSGLDNFISSTLQ